MASNNTLSTPHTPPPPPRCPPGHGRSATLLCACLMASNNTLSIEGTLALLKAARPGVHLNQRQRLALEQWSLSTETRGSSGSSGGGARGGAGAPGTNNGVAHPHTRQLVQLSDRKPHVVAADACASAELVPKRGGSSGGVGASLDLEPEPMGRGGS